ncbi:xylulokinase [Paenibacillus radicis (ex Xue et al. 2023)]|uniref:FGGY family carbohydrate kinase n=1 Tax=Paenibacillus radicis (ex Xue et al. 2023) TaxID=2972489 RepID=A0ABT1YL98_9BACL|nr:FGGY family carbohydrate kinase [Paenibacillus radicis (ex Xue et al. 2023)]MCR8633043.1 FGGY family carbohydrate kinase [Paenibacillus radicis (ex Xue et al. 2023)]
MNEHYFIGVDIGTQGSKAAVVSGHGASIAQAQRPIRLITSSDGSVTQDPQEIFASVVEAVKEAVTSAGIEPRQVQAISLDGQMAGIMGIDDHWEPVTPYDSWLDTRCEAYMPMMKQFGEENLIRITGCPVTYAPGPKILWWKHERQDIYNRISKFVTLSGYIAGRLAGLNAKDAFIDFTHLHFMGYADVQQKQWSDPLLEFFSVDKDKMPAITDPWRIIGALTKQSAQYCGLIEGIPIAAGCGDTAASIFGAGVVKPGLMFDVAGTASVLACCVDRYQPDTVSKTLVYAPSVIPGLWTPLAYINGGGQCLEWFREQVGGGRPDAGFDTLNEEAKAEAPGCNGLFFVPHYGGRVCPNNPFLRGSWTGLHWSHGRKSMYRAILESVAFEYSHYLDTLKELLGSASFSQIIGVGGGTKSRLFNSIKSDVLSVPYTRLERSDTAALANAVIAGYGVGAFTRLDVIKSFVTYSDVMTPNSVNHESYVSIAATYKVLLEHMTQFYQMTK